MLNSGDVFARNYEFKKSSSKGVELPETRVSNPSIYKSGDSVEQIHLLSDANSRIKEKASISFMFLIRLWVDFVKVRVLSMVVITTIFGYFVALGQLSNIRVISLLIVGTFFSGAGSLMLNQCFEVDIDGRMVRTRGRPLPRGRINLGLATLVGIAAVLFGVWILNFVHPLVALLSMMTNLLYLLVYTPLKRVSWFNTIVGAIPGALPPVGGYVAAYGRVDVVSLILFLVMFFWQHPHFYAIATIYHSDYKNGGVRLLSPFSEFEKRLMNNQIIITCILTVASTLMLGLTVQGMSYAYVLGALILGYSFYKASIRYCRHSDVQNARRLLKCSVIYLPLLFVLMSLDRWYLAYRYVFTG